MATALYRRYRPETFAEMIGQAQVTEPLMTALRGGKIGHAYLFSGPRGCGKTTSARVLARCLNCVEGPTDSPCGTCPSCVELSRDGGGSLDVIEIDAASHGGVDDARDLRERAIFAPVRDRYKIFIIDEAHMVTKEGFNALLKIVEEPPEHVKFVFATTEPEKVIGTIRSRTHHYPFRLIAPAALLEYVHRLCQEEGITTSEGVLPLVIRAGGGSARDTLSILDQLIAGSEGSHIEYERAVGLLGYTHDDLLDEIVSAFAEADAAAGVHAVDRVIQTGQDPRRFVEDLLERLRDLIIVQATDIEGATAVLRGMPEEQLQRMVQQSTKFERGAISRIADTVSDALDNMTGATAPRLHLELMVARIFVELGRVTAELKTASQAHVVPAHTQTTSQAGASTPAHTGHASQEMSQPRPNATAEQQSQTHQPAPVTQNAVAPAAKAITEPPTPRTPSTAPGESVNPAVAMRNARAFLAGADQQTPTSQPAAAPRQAPTTPPETTSEPPAETPEPIGAAPATVFDTHAVIREWPGIASALGAKVPDAGRAIADAEVLGVDGVTLHVGFRDNAHLETFKTHCAALIRSGFVERFGVTVQYKPWVGEDSIHHARQLFGGSAPVAQEPASVGQSTEAQGSTPPQNLAQPRALGEPGPSEAQQPDAPLSDGTYPEPPLDEAPPYDEPPFDDPGASASHSSPVSPASPASPVSPASSTSPLSPASPDSPGSVPSPPEPEQPSAPNNVAATSVSMVSAEAETNTTQAVTPDKPRSAPAFTRYGESVVREVLGAKFVGEQPLP